MDWIFQQIEGPLADRKKITLAGYNAPFGRPRKEPVIKEIIKSRVQTTRYPGGSGQTRHAFGVNWEPTELKGRWMTKTGSDIANDMADAWVRFVKDERTCRIAWGSIISWTGFIEELELARESEHEIAWRMRILLDEQDDKAKRPAPRRLSNSFIDDLQDVYKFLAKSKLLKQPVLPDIKPDFLEALDNLAAELNKPAALMAKLAGNLDSIEKRTFSTLQHFRGAVSNMRTAIVQMRETVLVASIDAVMLGRTAAADINWVKYQVDFDNQSMIILDLLGKLDRTAELAQRQEVSRFITALAGDTWESLSIRATGSVVSAAKIRSASGARYGEKPVAGESYFVP